MRVGITTQIEFSVFSSGNTNASIAVAELMKGLGHEVTLLNIHGTTSWWDDCKVLEKIFTVKHLENNLAETYDIIFEIGPNTLSASQRKSLTNCAIWIVRKPFVLTEIESSIFPISERSRDMTGLFQAWLLAESTSPDDMTALETVAGVPVLRVPFLWTPILAEVHHRTFGGTEWTPDASGQLLVHIVDTNMTCSSNSTLPLVILREASRRRLPIQSWRLHNGEMISKSKFFRENILKHCSDLDLSGECVGRQRCVEWTTHSGSVALTHLRFTRLRPVLLDLAWAGIPVIHNSPSLRDIGCGAERFFYADNNVNDAVNAFEILLADMKDGKHWFKKDGQKRREQLLSRWSPMSNYVKSSWDMAIQACLRTMPATVAPVAPVVPVAPVASVTAVAPTKTFNILFTDMHDSFQSDYNFFTLLLNAAGAHMSPPLEVKGFSPETISGVPDLILFGPFGTKWQRYDHSIPRVHFSGENSEPVENPSVKLNLGHKCLYMTTNYLRIPHWLISIDWFNASMDKLVNPKPIPLDLCTRTYETRPDKKFCAFVVSNPTCAVRNQAFHWVNSYKPVDSGGHLYNNIGGELAGTVAGGGGGEWLKTKFFMNYKFCLAYENQSDKGYCTEKYLHAKAAGCIPIYWGDPEFQRDFDPAGAIDARGCKTQEELLELIRKVDTDDSAWKAKASVPAMDTYRVELARRTLSECARRIYSILGVADETLAGIPRFLGAAEGSPEAKRGLEYFLQADLQKPQAQIQVEYPLMTTFATFDFLGSLQHWLKSVGAQTKGIPSLKAHIFLGADVPKESTTMLETSYPFATFEYVPSDWTPPDFPDFWEGGHYAWKLWLYHTMNTRPEFAGKLVLYTDSASVLVRWPKAWLAKAAETGVCCLEDDTQENDRWCGDYFCDALAVTDEERAAKQIVAGLMAFRAGHPVALAFFEAAFKLGQDRNMIVGPRLSGQDTDGKCYGHRQDQSILSILVRRQKGVSLFPLDKVYCDQNMRKTFNSGRSIYVHRGNFTLHTPFMTGIDEAFIINLERRTDRLERFYKNHPELKGRVETYKAFDGRSSTLTPDIAALFQPNDFFWKKAVMGCALSHLGLWWKLLNENPDIENYLIFEDDAKLQTGWAETLEKSIPHIPGDYDVLYLGGILPPNRAVFEKVLQPVTKYYSKIRPNQIFGQQVPTPYFHSCAYAYVLSRRGAQKIIESMTTKGGYWTSADHMMCNQVDTMNLYFLTPSVAGCYQDEDPAYANSDFNNFSRTDKFDSDLWNNDERFSGEEITKAMRSKEQLSIQAHLKNIYNRAPVAAAVAVAAPPVQMHSINPPIPYIITNNKTVIQRRFISFKGHEVSFGYEKDWLLKLFGDITQIHFDILDPNDSPPDDCPIVLIQRPHAANISKILTLWSNKGAKFKILHLSDEHVIKSAQDELSAYILPGCVGVMRNYIRDDFPPEAESKIQVIPLGYHWANNNNPIIHSPGIPFREFQYSFFGTNWSNRSEKMKVLIDSKLHGNYKFFPDWNDPASLNKTEYISAMLDSIFVPCPDGNNPETFRFYEALQCGCIPIVVKSKENEAWFKWVSKHIPLVNISSWEEAIRIMVSLLTKPETMEIYRNQILQSWLSWVANLQEQASRWLLEE